MEVVAKIVANSVLMDTMDKNVQRNVHQIVTKPVIKYLELAQAMVQVKSHFLL